LLFVFDVILLDVPNTTLLFVFRVILCGLALYPILTSFIDIMWISTLSYFDIFYRYYVD